MILVAEFIMNSSMERWFVIKTKKMFFTMSSVDGVINFISADSLKEYVGKKLEDIKVYLVANGGKAVEMGKEEKYIDLETFKPITEQDYKKDLEKRFKNQGR
jgi:hypothetical protein